MAYGESNEEDTSKSPDEKLLAEVRTFLRHRIDNEEPERAKMMDDLRFCTLDQWPTDIRNEREGDVENGPRPCLTIDKINQYIVQVVNDMRQGRPGVNVRPQDDQADIQTAKILKGLIRNIEDQSSADIAYSTAGESAAKIGLGYFRIATEYVADDSFDQEIFIRPLPNTFAVYLGPHIMPDGSDAKEGIIIEVMEVEKFKEQYPNAKNTTVDAFDGLDAPIRGYWRSDDVITVVEYLCLKRVSYTLLYLADGTTISEEDYKKWPDEAGPKPSVQDRRQSFKEQLQWSKMTGVEILEQRDLPGKYIPIVEVIGRESNIEGQRILWGLVRPAKDSLRMYNYWASTLTEKFGLAPKTPFVGAKGQFEGLEDKWKKANRTNFPYLEYNPIDVNGNALPRPERQGPTPMEAAYFQQMQVIEHDVQTSLGMFKAATGESESQQSGRAILALQKESDTGTYHFGANLGISIRHAGRIIVDMIPHYYDTKRVIRIIGDDGEIQTAQLDPDQETSYREIQGEGGVQSIYNPGVGKWDVSITTGPSYNTKRMEDQATFVEMAKGASDPASAAAMRYLVVKNSDNPGSQEAAKIFKSLLPPQALQAMASKEPIPPQVQAMMQQAQAKVAAMQEELGKLQQENVQLKAGAQVGAMKVQADAQASQADFAIQKAKQDGELQLAREKAIAEIELKRAVAEADLQLERMKASISADGAVDSAIQKVAALATIHQTKIQAIFDKESVKAEAAAEGEEKARDTSQAVAQVQALQQQFMQAIQEIVKGLTAKKSITMTMPDGRTATAQVTM